VGAISPLRKENSLVIFCLKKQLFHWRKDSISTSRQTDLPLKVIEKVTMAGESLGREILLYKPKTRGKRLRIIRQ